MTLGLWSGAGVSQKVSRCARRDAWVAYKGSTLSLVGWYAACTGRRLSPGQKVVEGRGALVLKEVSSQRSTRGCGDIVMGWG